MSLDYESDLDMTTYVLITEEFAARYTVEWTEEIVSITPIGDGSTLSIELSDGTILNGVSSLVDFQVGDTIEMRQDGKWLLNGAYF